jgi:hypothetical protein
MPDDASPGGPVAVPGSSDLGAPSPAATANGSSDEPEQPQVADTGEEPGASAVPTFADGANPATAAPVKMDAPPQLAKGLSYAVDIVFCIDVTGSMTPILDAVKANALRFYDDVQANLTDKGKNVDELRVRIIAFRDFAADPASALQESSFFALPDERTIFSAFVDGLVPEGGGDAPESGLEAVALAINSPWTSRGDRRRQVIVVWTDQPAHPLNFAVLPPDLASSVPTDFSALTDLWEDPQGPLGSSSKRLILFAPDGPGWNDISASWENVVHHPSQAGGGLSDVDYGTIIDSIGNSV